GHHWQDSTHITFGVATAGLVWSRFGGMKIEGSIFTGREPDENRYDFDRPRFDSYSGRISWNPTKNLALQVSHGYIKSPEALDPKTNIHRTTASAIYNLPLGPDINWSNSFVWGQNNATSEGKTESFLVESNYQRGRNTVYLRWERVEKSGHELVLDPQDESRIFPIDGYSIGYVHDLSHGIASLFIGISTLLANGGAWQTGVPGTGSASTSDKSRKTDVAIEDENLKIDLHPEYASVEVHYRMHNTGPKVEQEFFFPVERWGKNPDADTDTKSADIRDYQITVDGKKQPSTNVPGPKEEASKTT